MDHHTGTTASSATANNMKRNTVKFNVGGKVFELSRSLLDSFPDTMLYKAASLTWTKDNNDDDPIFIERNYDRFPYVLDYMRDRYISLPSFITKDSVLTELSYFGFDNVNIDKINVQYSPALAGITVAKCFQNHLESIKDLDVEKKFTKLSFMCFDHYIKTSNVEITLTEEEGTQYGLFCMYETIGEYRESTGPSVKYEQNSILKKCAAKVGMQYISAFSTTEPKTNSNLQSNQEPHFCFINNNFGVNQEPHFAGFSFGDKPNNITKWLVYQIQLHE